MTDNSCRPGLDKLPKREQVRLLSLWGIKPGDVAYVLGLKVETVYKYRQEAGAGKPKKKKCSR